MAVVRSEMGVTWVGACPLVARSKKEGREGGEKVHKDKKKRILRKTLEVDGKEEGDDQREEMNEERGCGEGYRSKLSG